MKKLLFVLAIALFACTVQVNAQNEDYRSVASATAGGSLVFGVAKLIGSTDDAAIINNSGIPAIELSYDYGLKKWFSLGLSVGHQSASLDVSNLEYANPNTGSIDRIDVKGDIARTPISLRAQFHYGNANKLDMYSGIRGGISLWSGEITSTDPDFDLGRLGTGVGFHGGVTIFGLRYYFTDNIGAGFELNLGPPSYAKIGVNARF